MHTYIETIGIQELFHGLYDTHGWFAISKGITRQESHDENWGAGGYERLAVDRTRNFRARVVHRELFKE